MATTPKKTSKVIYTKPAKKLVKVAYQATPPEARGIANEFRAAAGKIQNQAAALRKIKGNLDSSWEGKSKISFINEYTPVISSLDSYASWLNQQAGRIERMTVTMYRWEYR